MKYKAESKSSLQQRPTNILRQGIPRNPRNARKEPVALIEFEEDTKGSQQNPCPLDRT